VATIAGIEIQKGVPIPKRQGGTTPIPNPFVEAVAELVSYDIPTPDGKAMSVIIPGVTSRNHTDVNRVWRQLNELAAEHGVTIAKTWEASTRSVGTGARKHDEPIITVTFWAVPKMAPKVPRANRQGGRGGRRV